MSEQRLWIAVLAVASVGLALLGRNALADHSAERVGRRVGLSPDILRRGRSPIAGPPNAPYILVEFMDYQCGPCRELHAKLRPVLEKGRVALIVRHFPLRSIHPFSDRAARYALSVGDGLAASETHDALFELRWSEEGWRDYLRHHPAGTARTPAEIDARLREDDAAAQTARVHGTPTLFLIHNDQVFEVSSPETLATL